MKLLEQIQNARRVSVPLLAIETADQIELYNKLIKNADQLRTRGEAEREYDIPIVRWDIVNGLTPGNKSAEESIDYVLDGGDSDDFASPVDALKALVKLPESSLVIVYNVQAIFDSDGVSQAISNLREIYKVDGRMLIMMGSYIKLPQEISQDVIVFKDRLPDKDELKKIATKLAAQNNIILNGTLDRAVDAVSGIAAFNAEQSLSLSLRKDGFDLDIAWEQKRSVINQIDGLKMMQPGPSFSDIGGQNNLKSFGTDLYNGPNPPALNVMVDELEKAIAGFGTESSGTSTDQVGVLLSYMEDSVKKGCTGIILVGPPGSGKSIFAKSLYSEFDTPTIVMDPGAAKSRYVGESEAKIRRCIDTIDAISDGNVFWIATCNSIANIPPEFRRRFRFGVYYVDLPDREEKDAIWLINVGEFLNREIGSVKKLPDDTGWSGANIRDVCEIAYRLNCSLEKAADRIVPALEQDPDGIQRLRRLAAGRFISANYPGKYKLPVTTKSSARKLEV